MARDDNDHGSKTLSYTMVFWDNWVIQLKMTDKPAFRNRSVRHATAES
jgi:hypothetical protein